MARRLSSVIDLTDETTSVPSTIEIISLEDSSEVKEISGRKETFPNKITRQIISSSPVQQSARQKQILRGKSRPPTFLDEVSVVKTVRLPQNRISRGPKPILISSDTTTIKANSLLTPQPNQLEKKCPICFDTLKDPSVTLCGHVYCTPCIKAAIQSSKHCPICRRKIGSKGVHPLYL